MGAPYVMRRCSAVAPSCAAPVGPPSSSLASEMVLEVIRPCCDEFMPRMAQFNANSGFGTRGSGYCRRSTCPSATLRSHAVRDRRPYLRLGRLAVYRPEALVTVQRQRQRPSRWQASATLMRSAGRPSCDGLLKSQPDLARGRRQEACVSRADCNASQCLPIWPSGLLAWRTAQGGWPSWSHGQTLLWTSTSSAEAGNVSS